MCRGERPVLDGAITHTYGFRSDFVGFFNRLTLYDRLTSLLHPVSEELAVQINEQRGGLIFPYDYKHPGDKLRKLRHFLHSLSGNAANTIHQEKMVEPSGIEPLTPCLQSRCSPS